MSSGVIVGIDTSNYTTSYAIIDLEGRLVANLKRPLPVKAGECGLRQSDAVFAHVKNLPELASEAREILQGREILAIGVSRRPRNIEGSYMPCFLSGVAVAENLSAALGVPLYSFSHQCGHIMAAVFSSEHTELLDKPFAAYHVSGGTTELVVVSYRGDGFVSELVGGSADINAGQVIDRIGVLMGLPFPAGRHIEELALLNTSSVPRRKPSVKGTRANLSGLENLAMKLYSETSDKALTAAFVLDYVGRAIEMTCESLLSERGEMPFVFAGGVMCNSIIKKRLSSKFDAYFADPSMSADNAVGIAELARRSYLENTESEK